MARRRRRPRGLRGSVVAIVLMSLFSAAFAYGAVAVRAGAGQSSYVQAHGVRDSATVVSVHNTVHREKHSTTYEAEVTVHLQQPVNGTSACRPTLTQRH